MTLLAAIDFETTGLLRHPAAQLTRQPRIIEFGCVLVSDKGLVVDYKEQLINPGEPLDAKIVKITGLTDADLRGQPSFAEAWPTVLRPFLKNADCIVAHNLPFDAGMLATELKRLPPEDRQWRWPRGMLCTVELLQASYGTFPKLLRLYEEITGKTHTQSHRALADAMMLAEVIRHYELAWCIPPTRLPLAPELLEIEDGYPT